MLTRSLTVQKHLVNHRYQVEKKKKTKIYYAIALETFQVRSASPIVVDLGHDIC
jgi:hypothetical protein